LKDCFVENGVYAILNGVRAQPYSPQRKEL
jgi:hypothetical protein